MRKRIVNFNIQYYKLIGYLAIRDGIKKKLSINLQDKDKKVLQRKGWKIVPEMKWSYR